MIAQSFARIFYRNSLNIGFAILECPEAAKDIDEGDQVEVDFDAGVIKNLTKDKNIRHSHFQNFYRK